MNVIILAAGYATRLYPLTETQPKPLLLIDNKPILTHLTEKIEKLREAFDVDKVIVVSNDKFYDKFREWTETVSIEVDLVNDGTKSPDERLGAIKDIALCLEGKAPDDWLVLGGDNIFQDDLSGFIKFTEKKKPYPSILLYDLKDMAKASRFGVISMGANNEVVAIQEKPDKPVTSIIATCVYFFPKEIIFKIDEFLEQAKDSDATGKFIEWLVEKSKVFGYYIEGEWLDIGHKDALREAERVFHNG